MKFYCINPPQLSHRRERARQVFDAAGIDVEFIDGIHGATVGIGPVLGYFDNPAYRISPGSVATILSKLFAWTIICERNDPAAIVFEDDVTLCDNFRNEFSQSLQALPNDWDVVHVGHCSIADKPTRLINSRVSEILHPYCCHAVMWTRDAAGRALDIMRRTPWNTPSDVVLSKRVYPTMRHYSFVPALAFQNSASEANMVRWDQIDGWFDFTDVYNAALDRVTAGAVFVEIGCWLGKSTAYLAGEIKRRYAPVKFFAVDTWQGSPGDPHCSSGVGLFDEWRGNMIRCGVSDYVIPIKMTSHEASSLFADGTVDFIFIDGNHAFEYVVSDIRDWIPKLKPQGVIAGHDYDNHGVWRAVQQELDGVKAIGKCWIRDGSPAKSSTLARWKRLREERERR